MTNDIPTRVVFDRDRMHRWAELATKDPLVRSSNTMANLLIGLHDTDLNLAAWLAVTETGVTGGTGHVKTDFCFVGSSSAFTDMLEGMPFNRLIRQHRLDIQGDVRSCVKNWLLLYAVMRSCTQLEN